MANKQNLRIILNHLRDVIIPAAFDMRTYGASHPEDAVDTGCGCTLYHAATIFPTRHGQTWRDFAHETFDVVAFGQSTEWEFIFGAGWGPVDNTKEGACQRIEYHLVHGTPRPSELAGMLCQNSTLIYRKERK